MRLIIALVLLSFILLTPSCSGDEPTCIDEMIEDFQILNDGRDFTGIATFDMDGETFYVFDSGIIVARSGHRSSTLLISFVYI